MKVNDKLTKLCNHNVTDQLITLGLSSNLSKYSDTTRLYYSAIKLLYERGIFHPNSTV
jgi:hypothetical protein